ncbi:hypothetical protein I1A49_27710 [Streptomyces malaysiensis subsp. malaysiensis]|uniref:Uncharacterized protein n=1 Tax=Streptomyces malaysiensis TaxID=92644 RepID=A0ABX6WMT6_STRMQ|nr:hypothetical protein I1A49_27710 [Streptomyces solisilvae]
MELSHSPSHRVCIVVIVALASIIVGLLAGIGWVVLGGKLLASLKTGSAALAGCFTVCMGAVAYVHRQDS